MTPAGEDSPPPIKSLLAARRRRLSNYGAPGTAPGTLRVPANASQTTVEAYGYRPEDMECVPDAGLADVMRLRSAYPLVWVNVTGLADVSLIQSVADAFALHDLALEDVFHTQQRPKSEEYPDHHFLVARIPLVDDFPHTEQIAVFVGDSFVVCFQERRGDCFDGIRTRLGDPRSRLRTNASGFLAYAILDAVIDSYFPVLERIGEELETLENRILSRNDSGTMSALHRARREIVEVRRTIWPHREMINAILRDEPRVFDRQTDVFLRDCYDHVARLMDIVDTDRDFVSELFDLHMARINLRMNETMKVLTTIATLFIPLSFIAGVYGMNFDTKASAWNMPELTWAFGYPFALALMAIVGGGLVLYLYRKGWLSSDESGRHRRSRRRR